MKFAEAEASGLVICFFGVGLTLEQNSDKIVDSIVLAIRMIPVGYEGPEIECKEVAESPCCADRTVPKASIHKRIEWRVK